MSNICIYHNPRCSKSRQTLEIIEDKGFKPEIKLYLEDAPSFEELSELLDKLKLKPRELMRTKEEEYKVHHLNDDSLSNEQLINAMIRYPKLIERPIVVNDEKAVIGRPPENVLDIL